MKIFIDTNVLLGFYETAEERVAVFHDIATIKGELVFTTLTLSEFRRNRTSVLRNLERLFSASIALNPHTTSLIREMPEFAELVSCRDSYRKVAKNISTTLKALVDQPSKDQVLSEFMALYNDPDVTKLEVSEAIVARAHRRKLVGDPPTSPDKHTIGDEAHWETLLASVKTDLLIVSKDRTFVDNAQMLADEFKERTGAKLEIVPRLGDAFTRVGKKPPEKIVAADDQATVPAPVMPPGTWKVVSSAGFIATVSDGKGAGIVPMSDHPEMASYLCGSCLSYGPWNGARCLICGQLSDGD